MFACRKRSLRERSLHFVFEERWTGVHESEAFLVLGFQVYFVGRDFVTHDADFINSERFTSLQFKFTQTLTLTSEINMINYKIVSFNLSADRLERGIGFMTFLNVKYRTDPIDADSRDLGECRFFSADVQNLSTRYFLSSACGYQFESLSCTKLSTEYHSPEPPSL